jgi:hypothetical protein
MEHLEDRKRVKTGIRTNNGHAGEVGVNRFGKTGTTAAGRAMTRAEMNQVRIRVISNAIPEQLILIVNKCILVDRVVRSERTLLNSNGELIKYHIIPILPVKRRSIGTVPEADARYV